jgi:hypothetical protein
MPIMPDAKGTGRVPPGHVNSLDSPLSLSLQRNKIMLPYLRSKWSMLPWQLLCTTTLDATNSERLWLHYEPYSTPMSQLECH